MMNPIFYFFLALTTLLAATANAGGPVFDTDRNVIYNGSYYVIPAILGAAGGGLTLAARGDSNCPLYIGQETSEINRGIPIRFSNWKYNFGFVPESENLNIKMDLKATICGQSTYWWVTSAEGRSKTYFIAAGYEPAPRSAMTSFQIKKSSADFINGYNIVFCPNENYCKDVGIFVDEYGVRRLALSSTPFPVVFMKANGTSPKTMSII